MTLSVHGESAAGRPYPARPWCLAVSADILFRKGEFHCAQGEDDMGDSRRIKVHLAAEAESKLIGTILAFDDRPLRGALAMDLFGISVKLRWRFDQIVSIQVQSLDDAEKLKALGFEPAEQPIDQ